MDHAQGTDPFTGRPTRLLAPPAEDDAALRNVLSDDLERRLEAFDRIRTAASEAGYGPAQGWTDQALFTIPQAVLGRAAFFGPSAARRFARAVTAFRQSVPVVPLSAWGFHDDAPNPLDEPGLFLRHVGGGVEAWAFRSHDGWIYKFYRPYADGHIGQVFALETSDAGWLARAVPGDYPGLLRKLLLINRLGGLATELSAVTPEGVVVAKQAPGAPLPPGTDTTPWLPGHAPSVPSRFLTCDRVHPRLHLARDGAWLVADLHERNLVATAPGTARIIDLVAGPIPDHLVQRTPWFADWLRRARIDPCAPLLEPVRDEDL